MADALVTVVELPEFEANCLRLLTNEECDDLIDFMARFPETGAVMTGTGGVRKLRWAKAGRGKRSGVRAVYYYHNPAMPIYAITIYGKSGKENLTKAERNTMRRLVRELVAEHRGRR